MTGDFELGEFDIDGFMSGLSDAEGGAGAAEKQSEKRIIFAIDASGSMSGHKIGAVNDAVNNIISKLKSYARGGVRYVGVSVIGYASKLFRWTSGFVPVGDFRYSYVETADGFSDINNLLDEITALSAEYMNGDGENYVILFSDGLLTENYSQSMEKWKNIPAYGKTVKIAVSFEDDLADVQSMDFFREFTDGGYIYSVKEQDKLLAVLMDN